MIVPRIILIYALLLAVFFLFFIKFNVQQLNKQIVLTEAAIAKEKDNIHILKAELSHLSKPQLIEKLASKYLDLQSVVNDQLIIIKLSGQLSPQVFANHK